MKLSELAQKIEARLQGSGGEMTIQAVASLDDAGPQDITFLSDKRYAEKVPDTQAAAVIVPADFSLQSNASLLFVDDVDQALETLLVLFAPKPDNPAVGIHPTAVVSDGVNLAQDVAIGAHVVIGPGVTIGVGTKISPGCVIGRDATIGSHCFLAPNVVIGWGSKLGNRVIIHGNSTIGADGFGYRLVDGRHKKIPHIGTVLIHDDVEIGANACVDRAKFGRTIVGQGTKIDNLVQIAHNVRTGDHCIIVAQTGIAGSAQLGNYVVLGGQCAIADHTKIGDGVMAGATTGINRDIEPGAKILGAPALPIRDFFRMVSVMQELPKMAKELKQLKKTVEKSAITKDCS